MVRTDNGTGTGDYDSDYMQRLDELRVLKIALSHEEITRIHLKEIRSGWNKPVNTKVSKARIHPTVKRTIRNTLPYKLRVD